ncbi:MAG: cytochrome c biogenesis protein ResB, partial [Burkholderiales bacterium]|nr:cytochrome c biogenesis protein ResB [Opitutaceae bacterium]
MRDLTREFVKFFVSLKLTVALLALSALLVFFATLDQVHLGIWAVQEKWFKSFIVLHHIKGFPVPIFPGGYFIGALLLINLLAAHIKRFSFTWKKAGIQLVHGGLILLLVGELFTGLFQEEYQMRLDEGQTKNYSESWRFNELAVIDVTTPDEELVTAIPESRLAAGKELQIAALPFKIVPRAYYPNASLSMKAPVAGPAAGAVQNLATTGLGPRLDLVPLPMTYKQDQRNLPAALVEVVTPEGTSLGTFLVSTMLIEPEPFTHAGRQWTLSLRFERAYKPFSLTLVDFSHDRYAGTEIPKNFSSRVKLHTPDGVEDREVLIFMNNPLRYAGLTFFQAGFDNNDKTTVLQVVRNPSWLIPYLCCLLMSVGLFWQFGWHLILFRGRQTTAAAPSVPNAVVALGLVLSLRIFAGLVGLWVTASSDGTPATIGLLVLAAEFLACGA